MKQRIKKSLLSHAGEYQRRTERKCTSLPILQSRSPPILEKLN